MVKRVLLAGILGGIAMFFWSAIAHDVLPLGRAGITEIPNEPAVLSAMGSSITTSGLYFFPGFGLGNNATPQQKTAAMQEYEKKLAVSPSGILVYHPAGAKGMTAQRLVTEFLTELVEAFILVFLLAQTRLVSFAARLGFVALVGLFGAMATNVPYWNWYGFPVTYTASYMTIELVGFLIAGMIAAKLLKTGAAMKNAAAA
jgi:hypothetical protein